MYLFGQSLAQMTMDDFPLVSQKPQLENLPTDERKKTPYRRMEFLVNGT